MSITQSNGACPAILTGISEVLKTSSPQDLITPIGAMQALVDPENTRGVTMEQLGEGDKGHRKTVRISYKNRALPSDVTDTKTCVSGEEKPIFEETFDVTQHKQIVIHKDESAVRALCDAFSQYKTVGANMGGKQLAIMADFANDLLMDLDPLRQEINEALNTSIALNIGDFVGGTTSLTVKVLKSLDDQSVNNAGFNYMKQALKKTGYAGTPIVFGGGNMDLALMSLGYGCCNDGGSDFGKMKSQAAGFKFYEDYSDFATLYGNANAAIAFMPSTLQLVTYNKYVGSYARPIGTMERGTIPDPKIPGLSYDIRILPNECGEYYDIFINLDFDLFAAPTTLFATGDRLEGVNGVFKFIASTVS